MRRVITTLALALFLSGCSLIREPAPQGELVKLAQSAATCSENAWRVEGLLLANASIHDPLLGGESGAVIAIDIHRAKIGASPELDPSTWQVRLAPVGWPSEYTGVLVASGEVAVVDATGNLVAMTGREYQLEGELRMEAAIGGPLFGKPGWPVAFNVCRPSSP